MLDLLRYNFSFLRPSSRRLKADVNTRLYGERVILRLGDAADWHSWRQLRQMSRNFLVPWEPAWGRAETDYYFFCGHMQLCWRLWRQDRAYSFLIFRRNDDGGAGALMGGINLNDVQRGIAQKGTLGYWIGLPYANQGYMTEAASLVCDFAFDTLGLHRVEASCLPHNIPSKALLQKLGFTEEGFAKDYLQINGVWEDHLLWGKIRDAGL